MLLLSPHVGGACSLQGLEAEKLVCSPSSRREEEKERRESKWTFVTVAHIACGCATLLPVTVRCVGLSSINV